MTAIALALCSAALFGAMSVALRFALREGAGAEVGAVLTIVPAFGVTLVWAAAHGLEDVASAWPFALAGVVAPGGSQILFTLAIRDAGPSRTSVLVGVAPLFSVAIALVALDEPLVPLLVVGAVLIVGGGLLLVGERVRPESFRLAGYAFALVATVLFATRDNLLRWLSVDTDVPASLAAVTTIGAGMVVVTAYAAARNASNKVVLAGARHFALAGIVFGLSYVALFEAYYRGRVTVVSPLIATESLFGVLFSALIIRRAELIGRSLVTGALLIVAGGALIGVFR
ncbi:MAG: DMT family transporter [Gaiellaceae bacterium]